MNESEAEIIKNKTFSSFVWRLAERCAAQSVTFIVSIVLARLLNPSDYGLVAMIIIFIAISQVFVDSGLGSALIQKKNADDLDFSTVFYFNVFICVIIYLTVYFSAPYIANFYDNMQLASILRVLGITIIISALKNVQQAYVSRNLIFKHFFFSTIGGTIIAAFVGITLAYYGFGVWALVNQQVVNVIIDTFILWFTVKWRPQKTFSLGRLKTLFSYGWKLLISSLVDTIYTNLRQLIIGKMYSPAALGFYNRGYQFPSFIVTNINTAIDSVLLPVMSREQENKIRVKMMTRRAIKVSGFVIWPMMIGLFVIAKPLIILLLTDKWIESVPYLKTFCIIFALEPIQTANLNAIKAVGRSDIFLKLEVIKKSIGFLILLISMNYGVFSIAIGMLLYAFIASVINSWPNKKLLDYSYIEQILDILPSISLSIFMGFIICFFSKIDLNNFKMVMCQVILGCIVYVLGALLLKFDSFQYILGIIKYYLLKEKREL